MFKMSEMFPPRLLHSDIQGRGIRLRIRLHSLHQQLRGRRKVRQIRPSEDILLDGKNSVRVGGKVIVVSLPENLFIQR